MQWHLISGDSIRWRIANEKLYWEELTDLIIQSLYVFHSIIISTHINARSWENDFVLIISKYGFWTRETQGTENRLWAALNFAASGTASAKLIEWHFGMSCRKICLISSIQQVLATAAEMTAPNMHEFLLFFRGSFRLIFVIAVFEA